METATEKSSLVDETVFVVSNNVHRRQQIKWRDACRQFLACCIAHTLVIQAGVNMAFSAVLLPQLHEQKSDITINKNEGSWIGKNHPPGRTVCVEEQVLFKLASWPFRCHWGRCWLDPLWTSSGGRPCVWWQQCRLWSPGCCTHTPRRFGTFTQLGFCRVSPEVLPISPSSPTFNRFTCRLDDSGFGVREWNLSPELQGHALEPQQRLRLLRHLANVRVRSVFPMEDNVRHFLLRGGIKHGGAVVRARKSSLVDRLQERPQRRRQITSLVVRRRFDFWAAVPEDLGVQDCFGGC